MAGAALRVLAAAQQAWPAMPARPEPAVCEQQLTFLGLVGMMDPVRPEVAPRSASAARRASGRS